MFPQFTACKTKPTLLCLLSGTYLIFKIQKLKYLPHPWLIIIYNKIYMINYIKCHMAIVGLKVVRVFDSNVDSFHEEINSPYL